MARASSIEQRCRQAGQEEGLEIAIVRLFSVYGPGLRKQLFWDACASSRSRMVASAAAAMSVATGFMSVMPFAWSMPSRGGHLRRCRLSWRQRDLHQGSRRAGAVARALVGIGTGLTFSARPAREILRAMEANIVRARAMDWAPWQDFATGLAEYVAWARGARP